MRVLIGIILFSLFLFLSSIHIYWALGGKRGASVFVPSKNSGNKVLNPGVFECFIVGLVLLSFGTFVLIKSDLLTVPLPKWLFDYGLWSISAFFILRAIGEFRYVGFFKKIRDTRFGRLDTKYFSPLCLLIGILVIILYLI